MLVRSLQLKYTIIARYFQYKTASCDRFVVEWKIRRLTFLVIESTKKTHLEMFISLHKKLTFTTNPVFEEWWVVVHCQLVYLTLGSAGSVLADVLDLVTIDPATIYQKVL